MTAAEHSCLLDLINNVEPKVQECILRNFAYRLISQSLTCILEEIVQLKFPKSWVYSNIKPNINFGFLMEAVVIGFKISVTMIMQKERLVKNLRIFVTVRNNFLCWLRYAKDHLHHSKFSKEMIQCNKGLKLLTFATENASILYTAVESQIKVFLQCSPYLQSKPLRFQSLWIKHLHR